MKKNKKQRQALVELIKGEMTYRKWSRAELMRRSGVPHQVISRFLNGASQIKVESLESILYALDLIKHTDVKEHSMTPLVAQAVDDVREIMESENPIMVSALQSILYSLKHLIIQNGDIAYLKNEMNNLKSITIEGNSPEGDGDPGTGV